MKITLLAIHSEETYPGMPPWRFSLAFAYLQAYLTTSPQYHRLTINRLTHGESDAPVDIARAVAATAPDLLAISCYLWNIRLVLELLPLARAQQPSMRVVLGGPEINLESARILENHPDVSYLAVGEGEVTFRELVEHLLDHPGDDPSRIRGLIHRDGANRPVINQPRETLQDLNVIPSPFALGIVDLSRLEGGLVALESQRGCILECAFCNYPKGFGKVRFFDLDRVLRDLEIILPHRPRQLYLMDPTFNSNRQRAKAILEHLIRLKKQHRHDKLFLNAEMIPDLLTEDMILLARDAGMSFIESGIQSFHPPTIAAMGRYRNDAKLLHNIDLALGHGVNLVPQLIIGLPGDSIAICFANFDRLYPLPTSDLHIFRLSLLPGTRYRREADRHGIRHIGVPPYHILESNDFSREDIQRLEGFRWLVKLTIPFKSTIAGLCQAAELPCHVPFDACLAALPPAAADSSHSIRSAAYRQGAMVLIDAFRDHLLGPIIDRLPAAERPFWTNQIKRGAKRAQWQLATFLMNQARPVPSPSSEA
ncbi:MAG: B12-binding domain-containing radical SAM protein [Magnetococcales bacterium]|nr:B12-binding domain-containing radical SAM protein [Magnetococcales bacterium]